jgi:hypothetical protein
MRVFVITLRKYKGDEERLPRFDGAFLHLGDWRFAGLFGHRNRNKDLARIGCRCGPVFAGL